ncbi:multiple epidermal growth factor-like domains protein 10 [Ostrea edulis]|uniref:multiple epidermal growth factor-like domains protein 10 n=1 Tax=Ostrea edulis TaxID=37623 RepID=UPI0024AF4CBF|nr:multiple epidermal growth factor-like domains protein 10 [Ostrea edulis]
MLRHLACLLVLNIAASHVKATGQSSCDAGFYGDACQYRCSGNCANNVSCDAVTGNCPEDCVAGWEGKLCDKECVDGNYGVNCRKDCSGNCANGEPCGRVQGHCRSGCLAGWTGVRCDIEVILTTVQTTTESADVTQYTYILYGVIVVSSAVVISVCIAAVCCLFRKTKADKAQSSSNVDENPKENSNVFNTYNETYDSIYDFPISQNMERPPSYRDHFEHEYGKLQRPEELNDYVEIIE